MRNFSVFSRSGHRRVPVEIRFLQPPNLLSARHVSFSFPLGGKSSRTKKTQTTAFCFCFYREKQHGYFFTSSDPNPLDARLEPFSMGREFCLASHLSRRMCQYHHSTFGLVICVEIDKPHPATRPILKTIFKNLHMISTNNDGKLNIRSHGFNTLEDSLFAMNIMILISMVLSLDALGYF